MTWHLLHHLGAVRDLGWLLLCAVPEISRAARPSSAAHCMFEACFHIYERACVHTCLCACAYVCVLDLLKYFANDSDGADLRQPAPRWAEAPSLQLAVRCLEWPLAFILYFCCPVFALSDDSSLSTMPANPSPGFALAKWEEWGPWCLPSNPQ